MLACPRYLIFEGGFFFSPKEKVLHVFSTRNTLVIKKKNQSYLNLPSWSGKAFGYSVFFSNECQESRTCFHCSAKNYSLPCRSLEIRYQIIHLEGAGASHADMPALVSVPATEKFIVLRTELGNFHRWAAYR